jgi:hypothetical protein
MLSGDIDAAVARTLAARGFTAKNTLLAHRFATLNPDGYPTPDPEPLSLTLT